MSKSSSSAVLNSLLIRFVGGFGFSIVGNGTEGFVDGIGSAAMDSAGQHILVADSLDHSLRWIDVDTLRVATIAGTGTYGYLDSNESNTRTVLRPLGSY